MLNLAKYNGTVTITAKGNSQHLRIWTEGDKRTIRNVAISERTGKTFLGAPLGYVQADGSIESVTITAKGKARIKLLTHQESAIRAGLGYVFSRRCRKCNIRLTDEKSVAIGLGPVCRGER